MEYLAAVEVASCVDDLHPSWSMFQAGCVVDVVPVAHSVSDDGMPSWRWKVDRYPVRPMILLAGFGFDTFVGLQVISAARPVPVAFTPLWTCSSSNLAHVHLSIPVAEMMSFQCCVGGRQSRCCIVPGVLQVDSFSAKRLRVEPLRWPVPRWRP